MAFFEPTSPATPSAEPAARVHDRTTSPAGILPRHLQTWVVVGIALVMTGIIALSGTSHPPEKTRTPTSGATATAADDGRIREYRTRLDDEVRRLSVAQAELDTAKRALSTAPVIPTESATHDASVGLPADSSVTHVQADRAYTSLFADNVAFSLRNDKTSAVATTSPVSVRGWALAAPPSETPATASDTRRIPDARVSTTRHFPVFEGTIVEAVLTNRLDGSFAGPVNAMVTTAVYSRDRVHVLIPQGARLLGEAKAVASFGQQRLAVAFRRLLLPDGTSVSLDQFKGLSQAGATGLQDQVNHHYIQLFGTSLAIAAIGGLAQADTRVSVDASDAELYQQGVASSAAQSSLHILDRFLNVLPTVTIREGQRLKVYVSNDFDLSAYGEDTHD